MCSHCSPVSAASTSDSSEPECGSSPNANKTPPADESSPSTGPVSPATKTSQDSMPNGSKRTASFYDPSRTLMPDGSIMESGGGTKAPAIVEHVPHQHIWEKVTTVEPGAVSPRLSKTYGYQIPAPLMLLESSQADSRVRTCPSPASEPGSMESEASSSTRQPESLTLFSEPGDGCSLRTFPDSFPQTVAETSLPFSRRWPNSGFTTSLGECWTADTSECPRGGGGFSSLPDVLEGIVPDRFYLSPKAAAGILRRSQKRERELPVALLDALMILSARYKAEESADTESEQKQPQGANS